MTKNEVLEQLKAMGNENTRRIYLNHGAKEPLFGVKIGDLKKLLKNNRNNYALAMELWDSGNSDAMYLAGLMTDPQQMTLEDFHHWAPGAYWYLLAENALAGTAAESPCALELSRSWIKSPEEMIASAGWACYAGFLAITPDKNIDKSDIENLMTSILAQINTAPNRVKYTMNQFVISVGAYLKDLTDRAMEVARSLGKVQVDMGETACKVPLAADYIQKIAHMGRIGQKRKTVRC